MVRVTHVLTRVQHDPEDVQWSQQTCDHRRKSDPLIGRPVSGRWGLLWQLRGWQFGAGPSGCSGASPGGTGTCGLGMSHNLPLCLSPSANLCPHSTTELPSPVLGLPLLAMGTLPSSGAGRELGGAFPGVKSRLWGENANGTISAPLLGTWLTTA